MSEATKKPRKSPKIEQGAPLVTPPAEAPAAEVPTAAPAAPTQTPQEAATALLALLGRANEQTQKAIVDHLGKKIGYHPGAVGQEPKPKKKRPNPAAVVAAFGSVVHPDGAKIKAPSWVTNKGEDFERQWLERHERGDQRKNQMTRYADDSEVADAQMNFDVGPALG